MLSLHHLTIMNRYFKLGRRELFYASSQWWLHYICTQPSAGFLLALKSTSLTFIPKLEYIQAKIKILRDPTDSCSYLYEAQATIFLYSREEVNWMYYCLPFETLYTCLCIQKYEKYWHRICRRYVYLLSLLWHRFHSRHWQVARMYSYIQSRWFSPGSMIFLVK